MVSLLERKLIVVTGKGGAGKSTVACALGLLAARHGRRTIVAELGRQDRMSSLFGYSHAPEPGAEIELEENLWSTSIDPDRALIEWLRTLGGRISTRLLASSSTFQYFAAAAPGAKELVSLIKVRELCESKRARKDRGLFDLVILDAPATGHALAMLRSPQTFAAIVRAGPLADQAGKVRELLEDPERSGYIGVAQGTEMTVTETLELEQGLRERLNRELDLIIVNGVMPRRFTREELARVSQLDASNGKARARKSSAGPHRQRDGGSRRPADARAIHAAAQTALAAHERARVQQNQIARLRRLRVANDLPPDVVTVPFLFTSELDLPAVREIAGRLGPKR
jgi:anion-transporting  ArsA/GET3 family ATPase